MIVDYKVLNTVAYSFEYCKKSYVLEAMQLSVLEITFLNELREKSALTLIHWRRLIWIQFKHFIILNFFSHL